MVDLDLKLTLTRLALILRRARCGPVRRRSPEGDLAVPAARAIGTTASARNAASGKPENLRDCSSSTSILVSQRAINASRRSPSPGQAKTKFGSTAIVLHSLGTGGGPS